jgi:hypothetical protein
VKIYLYTVVLVCVSRQMDGYGKGNGWSCFVVKCTEMFYQCHANIESICICVMCKIWYIFLQTFISETFLFIWTIHFGQLKSILKSFRYVFYRLINDVLYMPEIRNKIVLGSQFKYSDNHLIAIFVMQLNTHESYQLLTVYRCRITFLYTGYFSVSFC